MNELSGGAIAANNGREAERIVSSYLLGAGLRLNEYAKRLTRHGVLSGHQLLFNDFAVGEFGRQIEVPLRGPAHKGKNRTAKVDFVFSKMEPRKLDIKDNNEKTDVVLLSVKSQTSDGSAEQKLWFEIQELIDTQLPSAMFVVGPTKLTTSTVKIAGWTPRTLEMVWDLSSYHGKNVLLFRKYESLSKWLFDKFPVPPKNGTFEELFEKYCDVDPCQDLKEAKNPGTVTAVRVSRLGASYEN